MKNILVDMSATLIHHGHIRILRRASELGHVTVGLVEDWEIARIKGFVPELRFEHRREILLAIRYVDAVIPAPWLIQDSFMDDHGFDYIVHGSDNSNSVSKDRVVQLPRTKGVSSTYIRERIKSSNPLSTVPNSGVAGKRFLEGKMDD